MKQSQRSRLLVFVLLFWSSFAEAGSPTSSMMQWVWQENLKPTIQNSLDGGGSWILFSGALATVAAKQSDQTIYNHNRVPEDRWMSQSAANVGAYLGSGGPGIAIALAQLVWDPVNGVRHGTALALTAASHITMASLVQRQRPSGRDYLSFPSGHSSSSFATATSLAYSYGYAVGIPAFAAATFVALSRVNENIHWLSDVVAGAALGIYWGRAAAENAGKTSWQVQPTLTSEGGGLTLVYDF